VTKSGLPLGYEVFHGNRAEPTTLEEIMAKMERLYGKASRIWVFDRGIARESNLEALRKAGGLYLVGTPRTLLRKLDKRSAKRERARGQNEQDNRHDAFHRLHPRRILNRMI
jgi:transposase